MWSRRALLGALGAGAVLGGRALAGGGRDPVHKLVLVIADGGWDVSYALDPKPGLLTVDGPADVAGAEEVVRWGELAVAVNDVRRPAVRPFFDRWADRTAVINGVSTGTLSHERSLSRVLSGHWDERWPDLTAVVGAADRSRPLGAIDLSGLGRFGPHAGRCARWGRQGQARALLDPTAHFDSPELPEGGPWLAPDRGERGAVDAWLEARSHKLEARWPEAAELLGDWRSTREAAAELRDARPPVGRGFPWGWAASHQGDTDLVVDLLARDLCRAVLVSTRQEWDTHARTDLQHTNWNRTFYALDQLLDGLEQTGQLEHTTVLVMSEMTRTPKTNLQGGKDHWPWTSFLVAGAGVCGRTRIGGTDDLLRGVLVDPESGGAEAGGRELEPAMVLAGVSELCGVDPAEAYPGTPVCRGFLG